jgi:hypothetical protein
MFKKLKIIIVAENASARMGGEAILPLHYFKFLIRQGVKVWLLTHERVRDELYETLSEEDFNRVYFVPDTKLQIFCEQAKDFIPNYLAELVMQWIIHASTDVRQRKWLKSLVKKLDIDIVHQPMPVSPKVPSFIYDVGAPVIIGSMNGGMQFPPAFSDMINVFEHLMIGAGHAFSEIINHFLPGKKRAALLLVANGRTRQALPSCACRNVLEFVENGVDLSLWQKGDDTQKKYHPFPSSLF